MHPASIDEVVAANVRRLREERGLTISAVAEKLNLGRHVVYDFERPRRGAAQRSFLWSEIIALCNVLDVTIFELVLPPEGERTVSDYMESLNLNVDDHLRGGSKELRDWWRPDDRGLLLEILFGVRIEAKDIKSLIGMKEKRVKALLGELTDLLKESEE